MKRINMNLPQSEADDIDTFADADSVSFTEIMRRSFKLYKFFRTEIASGRKIVISDKDGKNAAEVVILL